MLLLSPLVWTLSAIWGGAAGGLVYAVTRKLAVAWPVGVAVTVGFVLWFAWSALREPDKT